MKGEEKAFWKDDNSDTEGNDNEDEDEDEEGEEQEEVHLQKVVHNGCSMYQFSGLKVTRGMNSYDATLFRTHLRKFGVGDKISLK